MKLTTKLRIKEEKYASLKNALQDYEYEDSQTRRGELIFAISEARIEAETGRSIPILAFGMESLFSRNDIILSAQEALFHLDRKIRMEKGLPVEPLSEPPKTSAKDNNTLEEVGMNEVKDAIQVIRFLGMAFAGFAFVILFATYDSKDFRLYENGLTISSLTFISLAPLRRKWINKITREHLLSCLVFARWLGVFLAVAMIPHAKAMGYQYSDDAWKAGISAAMLIPKFQELCERLTEGKMVTAFRWLYWSLFAFFAYGVARFILSHGIA